MWGMEALKALQSERSASWPGDSQQDGAAVDQTLRGPHGSGTPEDSPPKISGIQSKKASTVPKKVPEEPKPLSSTSANPWDALPKAVQVDIGSRDKKVGETAESPVDGQDQPKVYEIRDHTLEVLMHPSLLELYAVRVVRTSHGNERQLHLKVRRTCGEKEVIADVLVDTGAQVSLVRNGLFPDTTIFNWKWTRVQCPCQPQQSSWRGRPRSSGRRRRRGWTWMWTLRLIGKFRRSQNWQTSGTTCTAPISF